MREVFICDAARTPIGRYGGALAKVRTDDLAAVPIKALVARNAKADWSRLDDVYFGCANQAGEDNRNVARMALLLAGLPDSIPGITVNRLCASGLNAIGDAARYIGPIGAGSVASEANSVSVGSPGKERTITNVAPGVSPTDAVNVAQLQGVQQNINDVARAAYSGVAMAGALAGLPQVE